MARPVRGHPTPWSQQEGTEKPQLNIIVPQQEGHTDAKGDEAIADYDPDIDYQRNQTLKSKKSMRKRKPLMQNMQK